ncbi:LytTR family transcriptional regulator DNA-binding domain-containing protein [Sediminibacterium ginsengisoli]
MHKSYIVSLKRIAEFENGALKLKQSGISIPLGESYRNEFLEKMKGRLI